MMEIEGKAAKSLRIFVTDKEDLVISNVVNNAIKKLSQTDVKAEL